MVAKLTLLRAAALGALIAAAISGTAVASDYIVVASNDPGFPRGRGLDSGQKLVLAPGRTLTLMHASGDLMMLKGAAAGVEVPVRKAQSADAGRLEVLRTMVAPKPPELKTGLGARRSARSVCPPPESLSSLDAIAAVQGPCPDAAERALEAYLAAHAPPET